MLNRLMICVGAAALCLGATCLSILAQDEKPKEDPAKEKPADGDKGDKAKETIKRKDVPEEFKKLEVPDLKDQERIDAGKKDYARSCANCHGEAGKGDGKYADKMDPKPTDLTSAEFQDNVTDQYIFWRTKTGNDGYGGEGKSKMKAHGSYSDDKLWGLVAYVRSLKAAKVEPLSHREWKELMDDLKTGWKNLRNASDAKDKDKGAAAGDELAKLADKLLRYDGDVLSGDHAGEKARDNDSFKKIVADFKKAAEDYGKLAKDGKWDKAADAQQTIGDNCGNCHKEFRKRRGR